MIKNIQALRGVATLLVLWVHLKYPVWILCPSHTLPPFIATSWGSIGVDIFFIISRYVISLTAVKKHHDPLDFFCARLARVVPLYLATTLLIIFFRLFFSHQPTSARSLWNGLLYLPVWDFNRYSAPPNTLGWTLSFEMWFYVVFALLLNFFPGKKVAQLLPALFSLGAALMIFYHGSWFFPTFAFYPYVLEFAFGCVIFSLEMKIKGVVALFILGAAILYFLIFSFHAGYLGQNTYHDIDLAWDRVLLFGVPCALLVSGLVGLEMGYGYILPRILIWFGKISFSFYLAQYASITIIGLIGGRLNVSSPLMAIAMMLVTNMILGYGCWRCLEAPLMDRAQKFFRRHPALSLIEPMAQPRRDVYDRFPFHKL